jgi:branched-chain amino acid transport system ATP-binding protein
VQLKRLDLARALASQTEDAVSGRAGLGVDRGRAQGHHRIIRKIRDQGITILMIEHIMQLIMNLCNRLVCIQFGTKIAEGPPKRWPMIPVVTKAYLGDAA